MLEKNIAESVKLKERRIAEIKKKNINNELFKEYFTNYQNPSDMYKKLCAAEGEWNKKRVFFIKELLNKMKSNWKCAWV